MPLVLEPWWPLAAAAAVGLLLGIVVTTVIAHARGLKLRTELRVRDEQLKHQAKVEEERQDALDLAQERLGAAFGSLATEHLRSNTETFLRLARESLGAHHERARGDLAAREQAVENLVRPIRDALARTETQIHELEKARREAYGGISAQLEAMGASQLALQAETRNLVSALRRPEVRGQWGEITLRRLVELAGMVEHCDFVEQSQQTTPDGPIRPDLIVSMPNQRKLVVDVKTPLDAYLDATQAADDTGRRLALDRHAAKLAERVRELSSKAYWAQFEDSPEFVILFIPGDQFLSAALSTRPDLLDQALRQQVILATPTSLVALLKAVAYGWQQLALAENAREIRDLAVELYERLATFSGHLGRVGKELEGSVKAYNKAVGSLERMVLPSARRFTELGVQPRQPIEPIKAIETAAREPRNSDPDDGGPDDLQSLERSG